jgi:hypothetical protein
MIRCLPRHLRFAWQGSFSSMSDSKRFDASVNSTRSVGPRSRDRIWKRIFSLANRNRDQIVDSFLHRVPIPGQSGHDTSANPYKKLLRFIIAPNVCLWMTTGLFRRTKFDTSQYEKKIAGMRGSKSFSSSPPLRPDLASRPHHLRAAEAALLGIKIHHSQQYLIEQSRARRRGRTSTLGRASRTFKGTANYNKSSTMNPQE